MGLRNSLMGYKVALWPEGCLLVGGCSLFGSSVRMRPGEVCHWTGGWVCLYYKFALITIFAIETNSANGRLEFLCDRKQWGLAETLCYTALTHKIIRIAKFKLGGEGNLKGVFLVASVL